VALVLDLLRCSLTLSDAKVYCWPYHLIAVIDAGVDRETGKAATFSAIDFFTK